MQNIQTYVHAYTVRCVCVCVCVTVVVYKVCNQNPQKNYNSLLSVIPN